MNEAEKALARLGERDRARRLYRERTAQRQQRRHPNWEYQGTGKRGRKRS